MEESLGFEERQHPRVSWEGEFPSLGSQVCSSPGPAVRGRVQPRGSLSQAASPVEMAVLAPALQPAQVASKMGQSENKEDKYRVLRVIKHADTRSQQPSEDWSVKRELGSQLVVQSAGQSKGGTGAHPAFPHETPSAAARRMRGGTAGTRADETAEPPPTAHVSPPAPPPPLGHGGGDAHAVPCAVAGARACPVAPLGWDRGPSDTTSLAPCRRRRALGLRVLPRPAASSQTLPPPRAGLTLPVPPARHPAPGRWDGESPHFSAELGSDRSCGQLFRVINQSSNEDGERDVPSSTSQGRAGTRPTLGSAEAASGEEGGPGSSTARWWHPQAPVSGRVPHVLAGAVLHRLLSC